MKKYTILFANTELEPEIISAASYNNAIKAAQKLAVAKKTIVISIKENEI